MGEILSRHKAPDAAPSPSAIVPPSPRGVALEAPLATSNSVSITTNIIRLIEATKNLTLPSVPIYIVIVAPPGCGSGSFVNWMCQYANLRYVRERDEKAKAYAKRLKASWKQYTCHGIQNSLMARLSLAEAEMEYRSKNTNKEQLNIVHGSCLIETIAAVEAALFSKLITKEEAEILQSRAEKLCWPVEKHALPRSTTLYVYLQPRMADYQARLWAKNLKNPNAEFRARLEFFTRFATSLDDLFMRSQLGERSFITTMRLEQELKAENYSLLILERIVTHLYNQALCSAQTGWSEEGPRKLGQSPPNNNWRQKNIEYIYTIPAIIPSPHNQAMIEVIHEHLNQGRIEDKQQRRATSLRSKAIRSFDTSKLEGNG